MLIEVISQDAEKQLLERVESSRKKPSNWGAFHFASSKLNTRADEDKLVLALRPIVADRNAGLYLFDNGDVVVTFSGTQKKVIDALRAAIYTYFETPASSELDHYYDAMAQAEDLRAFCKIQVPPPKEIIELPLRDEPAVSKEESNDVDLILSVTKLQIRAFKEIKFTRPYRYMPEILIVEDHLFYASMLQGMLKKHFKVTAGANAEEGWKLYLENAPDIVFLDIEMPKINGHQLAEALTAFDSDAFIVMVSAKNYKEDVARALKNGAQGFIVKPYNKKKILEAIDKFVQLRKSKAKK